MIKSIPCYTLICDSCGKNLYDETEYSGFGEFNFVIQEALDQDWLIEDNKHYCDDCWHHDDEDNLIIGKQNTK